MHLNKVEIFFRLEMPSVPLKATGEPGPPRIVEIQEKYSAVEGENLDHQG